MDTSGFALILGGGGARGLAHLGVLQVLEELNMRPSLIVGTSMGSVVGSLYASGWSASELENLALNENLLELFVDVESPPAEMQGGWWGPAQHQFSLQISHWPPLPDTGLSHGQGFESLVGESTADALFSADNNFDHLPIAFRCVSTDLQSYSLVVHESGSLPRAVKASSTIPLIFYPIESNGHQLVDGGFLDNVPVQVARRLGFDRAVIVDVSNVHLPDKEKPEDIYEMWIRVAELYTLFPNEYTVGENDVLLKMPLAAYRSTHLESAEEIMTIGRDLTLQHRDQLLTLRDACGPISKTPTPQTMAIDPVIIRDIDVRGLRRMEPERVLKRLDLHPGETLQLAQAWKKANWLTQEGSFHTIGFDFIPVGQDTADIVVYVQEETHPRLELGASVITDEEVSVMVRLRQENLFGRGGSGLLSYRFSNREARLNALLDQAIGQSGWLTLRPGFLWQRELPGIYENGKEIDNYVFRRTSVNLDFALHNFHHNWSLYLGGNFGETNSYLQSHQIPDAGLQPIRTLHLTFESHGRDLPVSKHHQGVRFNYVRSISDDDSSWWRTDLGIVLPLSGLGSWLPIASAGAVTSSPDIPVVHQGRAGGPRGWVGLRQQEIIAPQLAWTRLGLQYLIGSKIHLELAGAVGWHGQENLSESKPIFGGGLEGGMDSFIGPVRLGYALAEQRPGYVYLQVGHAF